jgi:hypothetical protein
VAKKRERTEKRVRERELKQLVRDRERLASLSPGGSAERPVHLASASVVEVRVRNTPCPQCGGELRVTEHRAPAPGLRSVDVRCQLCGTPRTMWFRLDSVEPN